MLKVDVMVKRKVRRKRKTTRRKTRRVRRGEFIGGSKWKIYNSVIFRGKKFKKGDVVLWETQDEPNKSYEFKISGIMKYDNEIDVLPENEIEIDWLTGKTQKTGLGRIPINEIVKKNPTRRIKRKSKRRKRKVTRKKKVRRRRPPQEILEIITTTEY